MPIVSSSSLSFDDDHDDDDDFDAEGGPDGVSYDFGKFAWDPVAEPRKQSPPPRPALSPPPPPPSPLTPPGPDFSSSNSSDERESRRLPSLRDDLRVLCEAALAGLDAAARAVLRAFELLLSLVGRRPRGGGGLLEAAAAGGSEGGCGSFGAKRTKGPDLVAVLPRPGEVAKLTVAVVAASLVLLVVVVLCDEVGRRLITETLAKK